MPSHRRRASRGTTLLEILIATALFAVLLAIAIPSLARLRTPYALRSAANQIAADVQVARMRAIARNTGYRMVFDTTAMNYHFEQLGAGNNWSVDSGNQMLPTGAQLTAVAGGNPSFNSRGILANQVTISVKVPGSGTRTVTINVLGQTTISLPS